MSPKAVQKAAIAAGMAADKNPATCPRLSISRTFPPSATESTSRAKLSRSNSYSRSSVERELERAELPRCNSLDGLLPRQQFKTEPMDLGSINLNETAPEGSGLEDEGNEGFALFAESRRPDVPGNRHTSIGLESVDSSHRPFTEILMSSSVGR